MLNHHQSLGPLRFRWCSACPARQFGFDLRWFARWPSWWLALHAWVSLLARATAFEAPPISLSVAWPCLHLQKHSAVLHVRTRTLRLVLLLFVSSCFLPWECARLFHWPLYIRINVRDNSQNKTTTRSVWLTWNVCRLLERIEDLLVHLNCQITFLDQGVVALLDLLCDEVFEWLSNYRVDHISNPCPWHTIHVSFVGQEVKNISICPAPLHQCFRF